MAEQKNDLTGLMDFAKKMQDSGQAPPVPEGSVMEEQKIEKIDAFESLDDYSKSNPAAEPPPESPPAEEASPPPEPPPLPDVDAFATTPQDAPPALEGLSGLNDTAPQQQTSGSFQPLEHQAPAPAQDPTFAPGGDDLSTIQSAPPTQELQAAPAASHEPLPDQSASSSVAPEEPSEAPSAHENTLNEPLRPANKAPSAPKAPLEKVRQYSEQFSIAKAAVPAAFPFSLMITGQLAPEEKERLMDLLSRENMGIRELDLEPQLESGKILIPRISEYAGVMIVSALRSARVKMRLGPSDSIYASPDTQDSSEEELDTGEREAEAYNAESIHPAEDLPITTEAKLPGSVRHAVVDIVTASAAMKTLTVQAESSPEYQRLLEALQREIKYKAFRKGATAIVSFEVHLTQLHLPMHYRIMVTGSAVRPSPLPRA